MADDLEHDAGRQRIIEVLECHRVDFIVIGGAASQSRGWKGRTQDIDVTPARTPANLQRLAAALTELGARFRVDEVRYPDGFMPPGGLEARTFRDPVSVALTTPHGHVDVCLVPEIPAMRTPSETSPRRNSRRRWSDGFRSILRKDHRLDVHSRHSWTPNAGDPILCGQDPAMDPAALLDRTAFQAKGPAMTDFPFLPISSRIFQSSDLKKDRGLLDAARDGMARLRDTDGTGLVMFREEGLIDWIEAARRDHFLAWASGELLRVELLTERLSDGDRLDAVSLSEWPWLAQFDADDLGGFIFEMRHVLVARDVPAVADALFGWEETAAVLADPERMAAHQEPFNEDDCVELPRPEDQPVEVEVSVEVAAQ